MVNEQLSKYKESYCYSVRRSEIDQSVEFVVLNDSVFDNLELEIQIMNEKLYGVYFLNNQYFELDEPTLLRCIDDILNGNYMIDHYDKYLRVITKSDNTIPERTEDDSAWKNQYTQLPRPFIQKNA